MVCFLCVCVGACLMCCLCVLVCDLGMMWWCVLFDVECDGAWVVFGFLFCVCCACVCWFCFGCVRCV